MPEAHSLFSASGAEGWSTCHGKIAMERGHKTSSSYADEGTAAHTLAERVLSARIAGEKVTARKWLGEVIKVKGSDNSPERSFTVTEDMAEYVDDFVDRFIAETQSPRVLRYSEQRVHYNHVLGTLRGEAFGTSDAGAIDPELLTIDDLKYGMGVRVEAEDNAQLRLYALGLLEELALIAEPRRVRMIIHQPRLDHWSEEEISVKELKAWGAQIALEVPHVKAALALAGATDLPDIPAVLHKAGHLTPSEKACRFCDAKPFCPALAGLVVQAVSGGAATASDFDDLTVDGPAEVRAYGDNFIRVSASLLWATDIWQKAVRAEIDRRVLIQGKEVEGFKVVAGKKGDRKFRDEAEAEALIRRAKLPQEKTHNPAKMKTVTQLEKAIKSQPVWMQLAAMITQADGKPSVVTLDDPRPAIQHVATADDFEDMDAAEGATAVPSTAHPFRK